MIHMSTARLCAECDFKGQKNENDQICCFGCERTCFSGVFAGSAALNVGANAQVDSNGGLLGRVGSGVGNIVGTTLHTTRDIATTATGASLGVAGQAVHASRDIAVNATDRAFGVADRVTDRGERSVEQARYEEQRQREQARQYRAEQKHVQIHGRIRKKSAQTSA